MLQIAINVGIIFGYTSVILVMLLGQSRVFYSLSRDGLLPAVFSDIHPQFKTPWRCNLIFMIFVCFAMMYSLDNLTWARLFVWLAIGLAIYFGYSRHHSHLRQEEPALKR